MKTFIFAFNAIMPVVLMILFGYYLKIKGFLETEWFKKCNKFVFRVCLPVLLFVNVYKIESFKVIDWSVVVFVEIAVLVIFILGLIIVKLFIPEKKQKGVILQCTFRSNFAIIGIPLASSLGGEAGMGIASIISAFSIPTFNILAVIALSMYVGEEKDNKKAIIECLKKIRSNPLILGVMTGLITLLIRSFIPLDEDGILAFSLSGDLPFLYKTVENLSKICSPLALIALGGQFNFSSVREYKKQIALGTFARVCVVPAITLGAAILLSRYTDILNFDKTVYPALVALFGSPVAVASAVMAQEMDNDGVLAGQLVVWTSIASIFSLFIIVVLLRTLGLL